MIGKAGWCFNQHTERFTHITLGMSVSVKSDFAACGVYQTADEFFSGGFSAAVLTDKAVDRTVRNMDIQITYCIASAVFL